MGLALLYFDLACQISANAQCPINLFSADTVTGLNLNDDRLQSRRIHTLGSYVVRFLIMSEFGTGLNVRFRL